MNCTRVSVCILSIALAFAVPAAAQQEKGDKEIQVSASMSFTTGNETTTGNGSLNVVMGYYVTRQFEIRGGVGGGIRQAPTCTRSQTINGIPTCVELNDSRMVADPTITAGFVFNLSAPGQTTVPYVGADYAVIGIWGAPVIAASGSTFELPLTWTNNIRPNGGVKFFVRRNIAFDINVGWDRDIGQNAGALNTFDSRVGFSYVF